MGMIILLILVKICKLKYDNAGRKLNLSVCKENIKIMKYIGNLKEVLNIESAMTLADSGIDVFNASDEFFNNICHEYGNTDGKDIIIDDRRTDIYKNVSFCEQGCTYKGMDYDLMIANCIYDSSIMQNNDENNNNTNNNNEEEKVSFNSIKKSVLANLFDFNFDVINCYNLVLNLKILKNNIGFYSLLIMFIIQLICFFVYLSKKLKSLKYFMLIFNNRNKKSLNSFPPRKNNNSTNILNDSKEKKLIQNSKKNNYIKSKFGDNKRKNIKNKKERKNELIFVEDENEGNSKRKLRFMEEDNINFDDIFNNNKNLLKLKVPSGNNLENIKRKKRKSFIFTNNFGPTINIQTPILNIQDKKLKKIADSEREKINSKNLSKEIKAGTKNINKEKFYNIKTNEQKQFNKNNISNAKHNIKNKKIEKKDLHKLETLEGKKKSKNDKEDFKLYKADEDLQDMEYEQAIIYDKRSYLRMYWEFLVDSQIILGTFCTENYLNLFVIKLSFFICTFQISFFLNAFFYTDEYISDAYHNDGVLDFVSGLPKSLYSFVAIKQLIRDKRQQRNYIYLIDIKLKKLRRKLVVYFILVFSLGLLFLYYVSSFCGVYRNSQKYWFMGCLESFEIDSGVAIIACIFLGMFRYLAIIKKKRLSASIL